MSDYKEIIRDEKPEDQKWDFTQDFEQEILSMLLLDKHFLIQSINLIKPYYFIEKAHEVICSILFRFFGKNNHIPPKSFIINEIHEKFDDVNSMLYCGELEYILDHFQLGAEKRDVCLEKIVEFSKQMALRDALSKTLDILDKKQKDKWQKIETLFKEALLVDRSFDLGLNYFLNIDERYERMRKEREYKDVFVTGIDGLDSSLSQGGLIRGEIGLFMAPSGGGKSIMLAKCCAVNVSLGHRVLYLTLEMSEDKVAKRIDSMLSRVAIRNIHENKEAVKEALQDVVSSYEYEKDKNRLIIKQFQAGICDINMIESYISQLALNTGEKIDLLIVDYLSELKEHDNIKVYESRQRHARDLRVLGQKYNFAVFSAVQSNRSGKDAIQEGGFIDSSNLADSYGLQRPVDALWSLNQNQIERACHVGRFYAVKIRDGKGQYVIYFRQDPDTLDLFEITKEEWHNTCTDYASKVKENFQMPTKKMDKWSRRDG